VISNSSCTFGVRNYHIVCDKFDMFIYIHMIVILNLHLSLFCVLFMQTVN
jgi:hypothetical protein